MGSKKANIVLFICAAIWGFAFVAQRIGMKFVGPFTFNGVRFALGGISLLPLIFFMDHRHKKSEGTPAAWIAVIIPGIISGSILFAGASLQQIGIVYTEAGKAAFITGLYIVLVPFGVLILSRRLSIYSIPASVISAAGLYFLCVKSGFSITGGDLLELAGAFFWAAHILVIDNFAGKTDIYKLAFCQYITCSLFSIITALFIETISLSGIASAAGPILYGGLGSVGVAYTLQIIGQKYARPSHSAIILSMETVFAAIGGFLILNEHLTLRGLAGCGLMLVGILLSQLGDLQKSETKQVIRKFR